LPDLTKDIPPRTFLPSMQVENDCNGRSIAKQLKSYGLIRGDGHIVSIRPEKSLQRSSGSSILRDR